jgi:hypothetical protein
LHPPPWAVKSDIKIDYLQKILYVIFTPCAAAAAINACYRHARFVKIERSIEDSEKIVSRKGSDGAWGGSRTRTALWTEGF